MCASLRRERSGLRCGQRVAMCQLRPKPAEPFPRSRRLERKFNRWNIRLYTGFRRTLTKPREVTMKRVLIAVPTVVVLAPPAWFTGTNAQYDAPPPPYNPAPP